MMYDNIVKMRMALLFMEANIVPMGFGSTEAATSVPAHFDIAKVLASMSPDDARKMKRSFRKMWRRLASKLESGGRNSRRDARWLGYHSATPTRTEKTRRKQAVLAVTVKKIANEHKKMQTRTDEG